jgi:hypothetical protein
VFRRSPAIDLNSLAATKASDPCPESYRVDETSIKLLESGKNQTEEAKVQLWQPFIAPSLEQLYADSRATNAASAYSSPIPAASRSPSSLPRMPTPRILKSPSRVRQVQQSSFLEDPLTPLERPEFAFGYRFTSAGHPHDPLIHDWEVQEAYRQYKRRYGTDALDHLNQRRSCFSAFPCATTRCAGGHGGSHWQPLCRRSC